ncbi:hypothetical protein NFI96_007921 [Prochilodus magdalenae]|nr:hypothetical protein NFI96_007921 [Prochilodus magdalenae]
MKILKGQEPYYSIVSVTDSQPAASVGPSFGGRTALESVGGESRSEERSAGRPRLKGFTERHGSGAGPQYEIPHLPLESILRAELMLLDSDQVFVVDVAGQPLPVRPLDGRMACWVNRCALLTPCPPRMQKTEQFHRNYCTLLLLTDRRLRSRPSVTITQSCSWSNSYGPDVPLHRSKTAYYEILQVSPSATQAQIKTAYYKQSFLYHPDKNAGSEVATQRFAQISEAYSILGSVGLRKKYDRGILSPADVQGAGRPSGKEASPTSRTSGPQQQQRSQRHSNITVGGKPMFDFDAFYQAHYGQQLQREQVLRQWRKQYEQKQQEDFRKWKMGKMMEMGLAEPENGGGGRKGPSEGASAGNGLMKVNRCQMSRRVSFLSGKEKPRIKTPQSGLVLTSHMNEGNKEKYEKLNQGEWRLLEIPRWFPRKWTSIKLQ